MTDKVVLAYSGGLDTSISIKWIKDKYNVDVIAALIDCGQPGDLSKAYKRALEIGACKSVLIDAKNEFLNDYIFPSIKANLKYEKKYPLATALARPLIAKKLVEIAKKEGIQLSENALKAVTYVSQGDLRKEINDRACRF